MARKVSKTSRVMGCRSPFTTVLANVRKGAGVHYRVLAEFHLHHMEAKGLHLPDEWSAPGHMRRARHLPSASERWTTRRSAKNSSALRYIVSALRRHRGFKTVEAMTIITARCGSDAEDITCAAK